MYPGKIGGIFFDEVWNGSTVADAAVYADHYRLLSENTKRKHPGAYTVLNLGQAVEQSFEERSVMSNSLSSTMWMNANLNPVLTLLSHLKATTRITSTALERNM